MVKDNTKNWEDTYNQLNTVQQSAMLAQSTSLDKWSPVIEEKWRNMANNSSNEFLSGIATVDKKHKQNIVNSYNSGELNT